MTKVYDIELEVRHWFGQVQADNPKEAVLQIIDSLKAMIDNQERYTERKYIDEDSGGVNYELQITTEHPQEEGYYKPSPSYMKFDVWDKNDYSYLIGKPYKDFNYYDIFSEEIGDDGIRRRSSYADCDCCGIIKHRKDMYSFDEEYDPKKGRWVVTIDRWKEKVKELGLNFEYIDTYADVCFDCVDKKKYMKEYERIEAIYEKE